MACVTYIAKRALAPGHTLSSAYDLPLKVTDLIRPSGSALREIQESISGKVETQYYGECRRWSVTLAPVRVSEAAILYEFLRSTEDGQQFTFDPYGTDGSPVLSLAVVRDDDGYTDDSFQREGRGGYTDWVRLGFRVREA
jgi:hypothetical protein